MDAFYLPTFAQVVQHSTSVSAERSTLQASSMSVEHDTAGGDKLQEMFNTDDPFAEPLSDMMNDYFTNADNFIDDTQDDQQLSEDEWIQTSSTDYNVDPQLPQTNEELYGPSEEGIDQHTLITLRGTVNHDLHSSSPSRTTRKRGRPAEEDVATYEETHYPSAKRQRLHLDVVSSSSASQELTTDKVAYSIGEASFPAYQFRERATDDDAWKEFERVRAEGRLVDWSFRSIQDNVRAAIEPLQRIGAFPSNGIVGIKIEGVTANIASILHFLKLAAELHKPLRDHGLPQYSYSLGIYRRTGPRETISSHMALLHSDPSIPTSHSVWFEEAFLPDSAITLVPLILPAGPGSTSPSQQRVMPLPDQRVSQAGAAVPPRQDTRATTTTAGTRSRTMIPEAATILDLNDPALDFETALGSIFPAHNVNASQAVSAHATNTAQQAPATIVVSPTQARTSQPAATIIPTLSVQSEAVTAAAPTRQRARSSRDLIHIGVDMSPWQGLDSQDLVFMVAEGMVEAKHASGEYAYEMSRYCTNEECAAAITKQTGEEFKPNNFWQRVVNHLKRKVGSTDTRPGGKLRKAIDELQDERRGHGLRISEGRKRKV